MWKIINKNNYLNFQYKNYKPSLKNTPMDLSLFFYLHECLIFIKKKYYLYSTFLLI